MIDPLRIPFHPIESTTMPYRDSAQVGHRQIRCKRVGKKDTTCSDKHLILITTRSLYVSSRRW
ncbi:hypothetical protein HQ35_07845 [Porphyromonas cangingivalis]|uniref:Uncharacterized protein n=1 Tax=Porphyromonas cangingivalis TaxID=36874 RepID=A0A0A2ET00_PORCN|nr:hypothetical protein [Porphyromonas cangingivalis]KGN79459.1 hypothetical protein HQ35_07845 [Porphyromonas cangingivalis]